MSRFLEGLLGNPKYSKDPDPDGFRRHIGDRACLYCGKQTLWIGGAWLGAWSYRVTCSQCFNARFFDADEAFRDFAKPYDLIEALEDKNKALEEEVKILRERLAFERRRLEGWRGCYE